MLRVPARAAAKVVPVRVLRIDMVIMQVSSTQIAASKGSRYRGLCLYFVVLLSGCGFDVGTTPRSDNYTDVVQQADEARKANDVDRAIPLYGRALQIEPEGYEAKSGLARVYLSTGMASEAAALFREILAKREGDAGARRGLASALIAMAQPSLAERQLDLLLQADPRDYRALNALGIALDMQGRHAEAQVLYGRGIEVQPDNVALRNNLGLSLAIAGQSAAAIMLLAPIANTRGADARVRQNLALAHALEGDLDRALQASRADLDEASAQRQLSYFMRLRSLPVAARSIELRRNPSFFPQASSGA